MATSHSDPDLTPAMSTPSGHRSQLSNPPQHDYATIICLVLAIVLSAPFVGVRMYTRQYVTRKLWWDDWTCLLGWLFFIAFAALLFRSLQYGGGSDLWNVSRANYKLFMKLFHDIEIVARVGMFFTKASIVLFYQRLFIPSGTRWTKIWWSIWFVFWWNLLYAIALVLAVAFQCVGKNALVAEGKECVDEFAVLICASVINVTTDLMILIIPIVAIWGLHMPSEKKWRVSAIFAVGTLGVLASVARLGYQVPEAKKPNRTIVVMVLSLMNAAEQFIGIIVSCLPILPAFYRHIAARRSPSSSADPSGLRKSLTASMLGHKSGGSKGAKSQSKDPYPLYSTRGYEELDEIEAQKQAKELGGIIRGTEVSVVRENRVRPGVQ